jgi:signal transduction histidine kinase
MPVPRARGLTKIGFRRDVRLFFGALVIFFAFLIVLLLLLLQSFLGHARDAVHENWSDAAQVAVDALNTANPAESAASLSARLTILQTRYGIAGMTIRRTGERPITIGVAPGSKGVEQLDRDIHGGTATIVFDATRLQRVERTFAAVAAICITAALIVMLLVTLYLPKITRPVEEMLSAASELEERRPHDDEQQYLLETFRGSIATLKRQEEELRQMHDLQKSRADDLERVTAALTRSLTSGFAAVDPNGNVVEVNAAGREIAATSEWASGQPVEAVFGKNEFSGAIRRAVDSRLAMNRLEVNLGDEQVVGLTTAPLLSDQQQFAGLLALFTDLTPVRRLEGRVRDLQMLADLGEISAGIAHEFRNSLATMLGYLRLARREALPERPLAQIEKAEREASLLSAAVDGLLAFARPMKLVTAPVSLAEVIAPVAAALQAASGIEVELHSADATLQGDAALLSRAFENLLRNAVESVQEKGSGRVCVRIAAEPHPRVEIEDEGMGVDPAEVPKLLLPFQSKKPSGYGLGLPLARKIVVLHGGTLELRGAPGAGATAIADFSLPEPLQFVPVSAS